MPRKTRLPSPPVELPPDIEQQAMTVYLALNEWLDTTQADTDSRAIALALALMVGSILGGASATLGLRDTQTKALLALITRAIHKNLYDMKNHLTQ